MQLYKHQQDIINDNPKKCGLFLGTGGGKTLTALELSKSEVLVICPKTTSLDGTWTKYIAIDRNVTVISKEKFRSTWQELPWFETVIIDEAHTVCGISPMIRHRNKKAEPKSSQLFDAVAGFLAKHPPIRLYLLTATPIRNPMAVYALGMLLGRDWDFYKFREKYYFPVKMGYREIWMAKKDKLSQESLGKVVQGLGYTGKLEDWVDVPEQTHKVVNVPLSKEQVVKLKELPLEYPDPLVLTGKKHQVEQGVLKGNKWEESQVFPSGKLEAIEDLYEEFGKVLVFAKYREQISEIAHYFIQKKVDVYALVGDDKTRGSNIEGAEKSSRCIIIAQSSISAGYELPSFRCTIFASLDWSVVSYIQALGRTLRINNMQKNLYIYLTSGEIDKRVYKSIVEEKMDFQEAIYAKII